MGAVPARLLQIDTPLDAERELRQIGVDPGGIAVMAPKMRHRCLRLTGLQCRQANVIKQEMLSLGGDAAVARGTVSCSIEATDAILIGTTRQLEGLCLKLASQPFGLRHIAAGIRAALDRTFAPPRSWRTSRRTLSLDRPLIMGILNVTPDSFSDGSPTKLDPCHALECALRMVEQGADIIDVGGESTRPGGGQVSEEVELARILPVVRLLAERLPCPVSVDTWKSSVARKAIDAGAEIINDISGFSFDPAMAEVAANSGAGVVLMHTRGTPGTIHEPPSYRDLPGEVFAELSARIETATAAGVDPERIVLDPGIGFSKGTDENLELLRRLGEFLSLGRPLLVGTSRKSFIGRILDRDPSERLFGTVATTALAVAGGASVLRVHDVAANRDAALIAHAVATSLPAASHSEGR